MQCNNFNTLYTQKHGNKPSKGKSDKPIKGSNQPNLLAEAKTENSKYKNAHSLPNCPRCKLPAILMGGLIRCNGCGYRGHAPKPPPKSG